MVRYNKFVCLLMLFGLASCGILFAQEESNMDFGLDIGIGAETFNEINETEPITYHDCLILTDHCCQDFRKLQRSSHSDPNSPCLIPLPARAHLTADAFSCGQ